MYVCILGAVGFDAWGGRKDERGRKEDGLHTGITIDRAWFFVVVPLNHGDWKRKVELDVSIRGAAGNVADTLGVAVDHREKGVKKELFVFGLEPLVLVWCGVIDYQ